MRSGICFCNQIQIKIRSFASYMFLLPLLLYFVCIFFAFFLLFFAFGFAFFLGCFFDLHFFSHFLREKHIPLFYRIWLEAVNIRLIH